MGYGALGKGDAVRVGDVGGERNVEDHESVESGDAERVEEAEDGF